MSHLVLVNYFFILSIFKSLCFNIDTRNPIIYLDQSKYLNAAPTNKTSYFGLSVILYPGDNLNPPWIQIGAPRSNSPTVKFKNPGIIFRCIIGDTCRGLEVDKEGPSSTSNNLVYHNKLDDAWIGGVMDINLKFNRSMVCAPRWINFLNAGKPKQDYRMLGVCYWYHLNEEIFHKKIPLLRSSYDTFTDRTKGTTLFHYGQGESGFAIHMPKSENEVILGAPGVFNWKGTNILFKDDTSQDIEPQSNKLRLLRRQIKPGNSNFHSYNIFSDVNVADARTTTQIDQYGLSGYAVTSGCFYSKFSDCLHYVTGAPRSTKYLGKVLIFKFRGSSEQALKVKDSKQGTQFGEYFGASLAAGDINNDGLDDLFVGAPFHKTSKFNEGRIYLFLGSKKGLLTQPFDGEFIDGVHVNAQFGATITYLGKLNNDMLSNGPSYVAVAAPYEDSTGVVYIFRGRPSGLNTVPVQRIVGSTFLPYLKGFGISISKPADIDGNGYEDIAIGAYESGHVVLLRSRPLVELITSFHSIPDSISKELKEFDITICHQYSSFKGSDSVRISRTIVVDEIYKRAFIKAGNHETNLINVTLNGQTCEKVTIGLGVVNDVLKPLIIKVTHNLIDESVTHNKLLISDRKEGTDEFCQRCGVYDDFRSLRTVAREIPFVLDCGDDNICDSVLEFDAYFRGIGVKYNAFILGATNVIDIDVVIRNKGEKAYSLRVQLDLPQELSFKKIPTLCVQQKLRIICPVDDPLDRNEEKSKSLSLDMDHINSKNEENSVFINVTLLTNSNNKNNPSRSVELILKTEADISITGKSAEQSFSYSKDSTVEFQQTYQISKYGFSTVSLVYFEIFIPYKLRTASGDVNLTSLYQPEGTLGGQSIVINGEVPYIEQHKSDTMEKSDQDKIPEIRNRRDAPNDVEFEMIDDNTDLFLVTANLEQDSTDSELLGNKTYQINCHMEEVICARISGKTGSLDSEKKSAVLELRMVFDTKAIAGSLQRNTVIQFTTYGIVEIIDPPHLLQSGKRPDMVSVSSLFVNDADKKKIDLWIIIVAVLLGLLLLLLITFGLTKAGFFKRSKKEELEQMIAQSGMENIEKKPQTIDSGGKEQLK